MREPDSRRRLRLQVTHSPLDGRSHLMKARFAARRCNIGSISTAPPNRDLVVYALYLLGGDTERVHTEDIALKCFELFRGAFSWVKHTEYPDKDIVRVALTDARKEKHGALVEGRAGQRRTSVSKLRGRRGEDGWMLTQAGIDWIKVNLKALRKFGDSPVVKEHRQKVLRRLKRIKEHKLFAQYLDSPDRFDPMIGDIADLLRCRVDAEPELWWERFDKLKREADSTEQRDVLDFAEKCESAYLQQR